MFRKKVVLTISGESREARIFKNNYFSHLFIEAGLGITRQLTRRETVVLLILFTFLGWFKVARISDKNFGHDAYELK